MSERRPKARKREQQPDGFVYPGHLGQLPPIKLFWPAFYHGEAPPPAVRALNYYLWNCREKVLADWNKKTRDAKHEAEKWERLCTELLYRFYKIDPLSDGAQSQLLAALMRAHVPSFQFDHAKAVYEARRSKKPNKLDVRGSRLLLIRWLYRGGDGPAKRTPTPHEQILLERVEAELKDKVRGSSLRALTRQMNDALTAYWRGDPNDFQRQCAENVDAFMVELFAQLTVSNADHDAVAQSLIRYFFPDKK